MPETRSQRNTGQLQGVSKRGTQHQDTPMKAKVQGAMEYLDAKGIKYTDGDVYQTLGVTPAQGKAAKAGKVARTHHGDPSTSENRHQPLVLTEKDLRRCEHIIDDFGFEGHNLT